MTLLTKKNCCKGVSFFLFLNFEIQVSKSSWCFRSNHIVTLVLNFRVSCVFVVVVFSSSWDVIIQCLVLLRKIAGPSEESVFIS